MKRYFFTTVLALSMLAVSCNKEVTVNHSLSLDKVYVTSSMEGGRIDVNVKSNGSWTALLAPEVSWVSIDKGSSGKGDGIIELLFSENYGEFRSAELVVSLSGGEKTRRIPVYQESSSGTPVITIGKPEQLYEYNSAEYCLPYYSNMTRSDLVLECDAGWVLDLSLEEGTISFRLEENEDTENRRSAQIVLSCIDGSGTLYKSVAIIIQSPKIDRSKFDSTTENDPYEYDDEFGF